MVGIGLYIKGSLEAVELYRAAFGLELGYHVMSPDGKGYFHSELMKEGEPQFCVAEAPERPAGNPVQLGIDFQSRKELEKAFSLLKTGGVVKMEPQELPWSPWCAEVVDRFGVDWFLSLPQHLPPADFTPEDFQQE